MRYLIRFRYDGTCFHGFQRQKELKSVQGTLENALSKMLDCQIVIKGSGRTDAGVHALAQCAHFDYDGSLGKKDLEIINDYLGGEIYIDKIEKKSSDFHARHSVLKKVYEYRVNFGPFKDEYKGYYYQYKGKFDIKEMKKGAKLMEGKHDFRQFVSGPRNDYTSYIYKITIKVKKNILIFKFVGAGFYRYMVRHLVGALMDIGKEKLKAEDVKAMLECQDMSKNHSIVVADGLYLVKVYY